jgi:NADP-dependent 3-hydroxy acid dehydrogenase YdfG
MNQIILAGHTLQNPQSTRIASDLGSIGIPFEQIFVREGDPLHHFPSLLVAQREPVVLLVSDNLLRSKPALFGLLKTIQDLQSVGLVHFVLLDGLQVSNGSPTGEIVATRLDRMAYALQYMTYWQQVWMAESTTYLRETDPAQKIRLNNILDETRSIANDIGELLNLIRDTGYVSLEELEANDYALFFNRFQLSQWHDTYRNTPKKIHPDTPQLLPTEEEPPTLQAPLFKGLFVPIPLQDDLPNIEEEAERESEIEPASDQAAQHTAAYAPDTMREDITEPPRKLTQEETAAFIADAEFWSAKGHPEKGIALLRGCLEQDPENPDMLEALQKMDVEPVQDRPLPPPPPDAPTEPHRLEIERLEKQGDDALLAGEFLLAKYCWDRILELQPDKQGIHRKLGLMTFEHLHDYRETTRSYLQNARSENPTDAEVIQALNRMNTPTEPALPEPPLRPISQEVTASRPTPLTVLITGATSGIGKATAELFASHGHRLLLTGRDQQKLETMRQSLTAEGAEVETRVFDVRNYPEVQRALANLPENWKKIDVLINNAGLAKGLDPIHEGDTDHWETMIDTNIKGLLFVTRAVTPGMIERKSGHVINVASSAGKEVYPKGGVYCATKFAVDALTKGMRLDFSPHQIRVSQVSPGHTEDTAFALTRFDGDAARARIYDDFQPLKAADVAETIYFIATRPAHVNIQDVWMFSTQQASSTIIHRTGR